MTSVSKHARFYIETVTFCVENNLFNVPRFPFEKESVVFGDMFQLPTGDHQEEGKSDDRPIHLDGIKKEEFELFLSVLLHRSHGMSQKSLPTTSEQWTSVLALANLWGFDTICKVALDHLGSMLLPVDRAVLGQIYDLDFESWSLPAMNEIAQRRKPISLDEARRMGLEMTVKLASVRELFSCNARYSHDIIVGRRARVKELDFKPVLRETFKS